MKIKKTPLTSFKSPYSICSGMLDGRRMAASGSENIGGELRLHLLEQHLSIGVSENPGGFMAIIPTDSFGGPGLLTAEGLHPNFITKDAGISLYSPENGWSGPWNRRRLVDLPYIHRMALVRAGGRRSLIAATLCGAKEHIDDWSRPGAVYEVVLPEKQRGSSSISSPVTLLDGVTKNHGMYVKSVGSGECVYISGEEGIFTLQMSGEDEGWIVKRIINRPVSELAVCDLDEDGEDEVATIEPFHGDRLCVYKQIDGRFEPVFEADTETGHGIWAGRLGGGTGFVHGSRAGARDLFLYHLRDAGTWKFERIVLDRGVGTAQIAVENLSGHDVLYAANNHTDEVAAYELTP
jgi:hypothetical protein